MTLIDTHAHISYDDYADRIDEVIQAAEEMEWIKLYPLVWTYHLLKNV